VNPWQDAGGEVETSDEAHLERLDSSAMMRPEVLHDRASEVLGGAVSGVGAERPDAGRVLSASQDQGRQLRVVEAAVAWAFAPAAQGTRQANKALR
jgi:hypothetical protein